MMPICPIINEECIEERCMFWVNRGCVFYCIFSQLLESQESFEGILEEITKKLQEISEQINDLKTTIDLL